MLTAKPLYTHAGALTTSAGALTTSAGILTTSAGMDGNARLPDLSSHAGNLTKTAVARASLVHQAQMTVARSAWALNKSMHGLPIVMH